MNPRVLYASFSWRSCSKFLPQLVLYLIVVQYHVHSLKWFNYLHWYVFLFFSWGSEEEEERFLNKAILPNIPVCTGASRHIAVQLERTLPDRGLLSSWRAGQKLWFKMFFSRVAFVTQRHILQDTALHHSGTSKARKTSGAFFNQRVKAWTTRIRKVQRVSHHEEQKRARIR